VRNFGEPPRAAHANRRKANTRETTFVALLAMRKPSFRSRGIARRVRLIDAARALLQTHELDAISLGDVAKRANDPVSSAYHFYSDIRDLYTALLSSIEEQLLEEYRKPLREAARAWPDIIAVLIRKGVKLLSADPAARQLMVGPKTPADLKLRERTNDIALGKLYENHVSARFQLPATVDGPKIFFRVVEIIDLMFCLSMVECGFINEEYTREAIRASVAYLGSYLPATLPRRNRRSRT
jgi:AcrR family transcriptional regulator